MKNKFLKFSIPIFLSLPGHSYSMKADLRCTTQQSDVSYDAKLIEAKVENIADEQTLQLSFYRLKKKDAEKEHIADALYRRDESYKPRTPTSKNFYKFNVEESDSFPDGTITPVFLDKKLFTDNTTLEGELKFAGIGYGWTRYQCEKVVPGEKPKVNQNKDLQFTIRKSLSQPKTMNAWQFDLEVQRLSPNAKLTPIKSLQIRVSQKGSPDLVALFPEPTNEGTAFEKNEDESVSLTHKYSFKVVLPRNMGPKDTESLEVHLEAWDQQCFGEQLDCAFLKIVGGHRVDLTTLTKN